jgi:DNA polymerase III subunit delta'
MVAMSDAVPAPWIARQLEGLLAQRGHAWLLQGPSGLGQYTLALGMVRAWLCEQPSPAGACGSCASCHSVDVRTHADLCVLMPETVMLERRWPLGEKAQADIDDKKRKPSKEIRVDAMRDAIEFSQRTSASGRGKAILVFPAERMNAVTANALLKTLEEPAGDVRFVLASEAAQQLLPTIRSRCLAHAMVWPAEAEVLAWFAAQGMDAQHGATWLRAAGGRPDDALELAHSGQDAAFWAHLPKAIQRGDPGPVQGMSPVQVVGVLHKLCHDMQLHQQGARPRFFQPQDLPAAGSLMALSQWGRDLSQATRTMEHPFNPGLMIEALLSQAKIALNSRH